MSVFKCVVVHAALALRLEGSAAMAVSHELYKNIVPANTSDCLDKVSSLPLVMYEFKYDSVKGRRQLGSVGPGLEGVIPESVEIHARSAYPSPNKGEPPITLENTAVVDKTVIFMNNVGATQELVKRSEKLWEQLDELMQNDLRMDSAVADIESRMREEADAQLVERKRIAEAEAEEARLAVELERVKADEYRKTMEIEAEQQRQALEHQTLVAKRKVAAEAESERARKAELLRMQEESARRRETLRLETEKELRNRRMELEREMDVTKLQMDVERVKAEVQAKLEAEKENEQLVLRKIRAQGEEDRKRVQETINTVLKHLASAAVGVVANPRRTIVMTAWLLGLAFGYLILKEATALLRQLVESYLGKPGLVRETSRMSGPGAVLRKLRCWASLVLDVPRMGIQGSCNRDGRNDRGVSPREEAERSFHDVVLAPDLKEQVLSLSVATRNARANGAPYRHLLLYGPPGTGKTMVAKRLATCSGMDCAIMSGGDVGPLGKDAVTELHALFRWAAKSSRGLLLFIDEAEAFLGKRSSPNMSEDTRNALNALLYNTGTASHRLMMVLATNRAEDLDEAVLDRMDDSLLFPIPDNRSCARLLVQYFNKYCAPRPWKGVHRGRKSGGKRTCTLREWFARSVSVIGQLLEKVEKGGVRVEDEVDDRMVSGLAEQVHGFSGREVSKLMLAVQSCAFGSEGGVLTADMLKRVVAQKASEHSTKAEMRTRRDLP